MKNVTKFVSWDVPALETLANGKAYIIMDKLNNGVALTRAEKDSLDFSGGSYMKVMGWRFDFRPYCKRFLVKDRNYGWREIWAFDKTQIRNTYWKKSDIVEIICC